MERKVNVLEACEFETVLLAMAGHDLRQPLQIFQYVHDRFGNGARTRSELDMLRVGQGAIDRLRAQLDQLLAALQLRERAGHIEASPVALEPLLREVYRESEWSVLQKGLEIRLVPSAAWIMSDPLLLRAVVRNLLNNAIKYTEPGGRISWDAGTFAIAFGSTSSIPASASPRNNCREFSKHLPVSTLRGKTDWELAFSLCDKSSQCWATASTCVRYCPRGTRFSILAKLAHGSEPS